MTAPITAPYATVPDYILGCTREIWEGRSVGAGLARYYASDCCVRAPSGLTTSMAGVAADTLATLHQFPDRQLVGEDVVWKNTGGGDFLSSHRLISVMHHTGDGRWGTASGRLVKARVIADCWVTGGVITEEWLIRDGAAFARSFGQTPRELAARLLAADRAAGRPAAFLTPAGDVASRYTAAIGDDPAAQLVAAAYREIWGERTLTAIRRRYHDGAAIAVPGGDVCNGHDDFDRFVIGYLAALPDARLTLYDATVVREPEAPVRVALRWALDGTHSGWGAFGAPTGTPLHVMGLSHVHVTAGRIAAEWLLVDEVAIWTQVLAAG